MSNLLLWVVASTVFQNPLFWVATGAVLRRDLVGKRQINKEWYWKIRECLPTQPIFDQKIGVPKFKMDDTATFHIPMYGEWGYTTNPGSAEWFCLDKKLYHTQEFLLLKDRIPHYSFVACKVRKNNLDYIDEVEVGDPGDFTLERVNARLHAILINGLWIKNLGEYDIVDDHLAYGIVVDRSKLTEQQIESFLKCIKK